MKPFIFFKNSFHDIQRNKKRSILTMLGIIIGIASVITIMAIGSGFESYVVDSLTPADSDDLQITIYFQPDQMDLIYSSNVEFYSPQELRKINRLAGVRKAEIEDNSEIDSLYLDVPTRNASKRVNVNLIHPKNIDLMEKVEKGRDINDLDLVRKNRVATISSSFAKEVFKDLEPINRAVLINGLEYTVVGVYHEIEDSFFTVSGPGLMTAGDIQLAKSTYDFHNVNSENSNILTVSLEKGYAPKEVTDTVIEYLEEHGSMRYQGNYQSMDLSELTDGISKILNSITIFISLIAGISLLIAGIGMTNMIYISVAERTQEIGIRRALGAKKSEIRQQFILEATILTVIGGIVGYLFGVLVALTISNFLPFSVRFDLGPIIATILISIGIGVVFSYAPANQAANKNVIDIL